MRRRDLLAAAGGLGSFLIAGESRAADRHSLERAAHDAYLYALPLIEVAASRASSFEKRGGVPNRLDHDRTLATPAFRTVTTPNNDTLYSWAWIDLSAGPVTIETPSVGDRYFSAAFLDMYTNNFAVTGTRTTGGDDTKILLVGPRGTVPDPQAVRSPTRWVWLLVRIGIDGESDLPAAHAVQDRIRLTAPKVAMPLRTAPRNASWREYFADAQRLIAENTPPLTDRSLFAAIAPLGIGPFGGFDAARFGSDEIAAIERGVEAAKATLLGTSRPGHTIDGWSYSKFNTGEFGQDYLYRAQVALGGLGALPREEAMYMRCVSEAGRGYFGPDERYKLHFKAGQLPPVGAFWSMTMYEQTEAGQFFMTENPIARYSIGDRTPGLLRGTDGSLTIWMTPEKPDDGSTPNWLPSPAGKNWSVILRAYLPKDELLSGGYRLPKLEVI